MSQSTNIIRSAIIVVVAAVVAIWLGVAVVSDQKQTIFIGFGIGLALISLLLGQRIWLLLLFLMSTHIPIIRGILSVQLGEMLFIGISVLIFMIRRLSTDFRKTGLEIWRYLVLAAVVQVYLRNPVGLNLFGSSAIGGKPYLLVGIAFVAGFILSKYKVPPKDLRLAVWASISGAIINFPLSIMRGKVMGIGAVRGPSGMEAVGGLELEGAGRDPRAQNVAEILARIVIWRISPMKSLIRPLWGIVIVSSVMFAALSGYRNAVAMVGLIYVFGVYYWGGRSQVFVSAACFALFLGVLALVNVNTPLPPNVQRALSPFPGTWEEQYAGQAERSTEWRIEMWKEALSSDEWIQNKVLGDGLGFTRQELRRMQDAEAGIGGHRTRGDLTSQQVNMLIQGNYHSGPVQTVRTIGWVGLIALWMAMIHIMVFTHRLIKRARSTEWWGTVLFFGVPIMAFPIFWTFVFGTFQDGVTFVFLESAILDLLSKNLPLPKLSKPQPYAPLAISGRQQRAA